MNKDFKNMLFVFFTMFLLAMFSTTLSPFMTTIKKFYNLTDNQVAIIPAVIFLAALIMNILGARLAALLGLRKGLCIGSAIGILASVIVVLSRNYYMLLVGAFIQGISYGLVCVFSTNVLTLLPVKYQKYSLFNAFYGFGGMIILPIAKFFIKNNINFYYVYIIHICTFSILLLLSARIGQLPKVNTEFEWSHIIEVLKDRRVMMFAIAIFVYVGAEISTTTWSGTFLESHYSISKVQVPNILLVFWLLFSSGRLIGDKFINKFGRLKMLIISTIGSIIGILILLMGQATFNAYLGIAVIGTMISLQYPCIQGFVAASVSRDRLPSVNTVITTSNSLGAFILTYLIGLSATLNVNYVFIIQIAIFTYICILAVRFLKYQK